jgi:very-short-patch-repair endonuclease
VHGDRHVVQRLEHRGLPITTPSQAIVDFAATGPADLLRLVLANADYQQLLDVRALQGMIGRGVAGSTALKDALQIHLPELAHTRSELEALLLTFCQSHDLPIPRVNVYVEGWLVDAHWPDHRLIVEVDGWDGHRTRAQLDSDHRRDLALRAAGYVVLRYTWRQLTETPAAVAADLARYLS